MKIIYPRQDGLGISLIMPAPSAGITIEEIARKDTPAGVPYLIVNDSDVPEEIDFFDAWEADFSNPHGYGIGAEAWFAEQASKQSGE
jgi:hypothetical protein